MSKTIAIIDDEEVFHWITRQFIAKIDANVEILSFYNGREALDHLQSGGKLPDIFMVDLNMPVANGWVFLNDYTVSDFDKSARIYVVSSSIDPEDKKKARAYEYVVDFVSKPISIEFLEKALNQTNL